MRAQVKALHQELQQLRAHHKALLQSDSRARMDDAGGRHGCDRASRSSSSCWAS